MNPDNQDLKPLTYRQLEFLLELSKHIPYGMSAISALEYPGFVEFLLDDQTVKIIKKGIFINGDVWLNNEGTLMRVYIQCYKKLPSQHFTYLLKTPLATGLIFKCSGILHNDKFEIAEKATYASDKQLTPGELIDYNCAHRHFSSLKCTQITDQKLLQQIHTLTERTTRSLKQPKIFDRTECSITCVTTGGALDVYYKAVCKLEKDIACCVPSIQTQHDLLNYLAEHATTRD